MVGRRCEAVGSRFQETANESGDVKELALIFTDIGRPTAIPDFENKTIV